VMPTEAQVMAIDRVADRTEKKKRCTNCGHPKPIGEFGRNRSTRDEHTSQCLWCLRVARTEYYHEGGGKEVQAAYQARPEVKARRLEYERGRPERRRASRRAYNNTTRARVAKCRCKARRKLREAVTDGRRAELEALIALYDREIARIDAHKATERAAELPAEPVPPAGDCDFRGVVRTKHGTFAVVINLPGRGNGQVRGGTHATIEAARAEANRLGREHGIDEYAVPKWRRRA
jgi:hypothetical protein